MRWFLLVLLLSVGCRSELTEVVVIVEGEQAVRDRSRALAVSVTTHRDEASVPPSENSSAPWSGGTYRISLSPDDDDAPGRYRVDVRALEGGRPVASATLISGYVTGQTRYVRLLLEDACIGRPACPIDSTCHAGACVDAAIDVRSFALRSESAPLSTSLPPLTPAPTPLEDGGMITSEPAITAEPRDAAMPPVSDSASGPKDSGAQDSGAQDSSVRDSGAAMAQADAGAAAPRPIEVESGYGWFALRGGRIGPGNAPNSQLRKLLTLRVASNDDFEVGPAFAVRSEVGGMYDDVIVVVRNRSTELRCDVQSEPTVLRDVSGAPIRPGILGATPAGSPGLYLEGSLLHGTRATSEDECLYPNETGYLTYSSGLTADGAPLFDRLASVEVALTSRTGSFSPPSYRLVPTSFQPSGSGLSFTFTHTGEPTAATWSGRLEPSYILFDEEGLPLDIGVVTLPSMFAIMSSGTVVGTATLPFQGTATSLKVQLPKILR